MCLATGQVVPLRHTRLKAKALGIPTETMAQYTDTITLDPAAALESRQYTLSELGEITVLVGRNGSGKSVLLRAWRDQTPDQVHYVAPERTGDLEYQPQFISEESDGPRRRNGSSRNFVLDYRRRVISRVHSYLMKRGNWRKEAACPAPPEELETLIQVLLPDFSVRLRETDKPYEIQRVSNGAFVSQIDHLSSGEAQMLTVGLDIVTVAAMWEVDGAPRRILLLDEPDAHVHPDLQVRFADFLVQACKKFALQSVVATHSTALLSALGQLGGAKTKVVYLSRERQNYKAEVLDKVRREMATCLGGHLLMGPLFGAPILLVEGDDDYRVWSQVPRHNKISLAVIPSGGDEIKQYQRKLETLLSSLMERPTRPVGYALLDGDKPIPQDSPQNPQSFIRFLVLNCHEVENLYLTEQVLALFDMTTERALEILTAHANRSPSFQLQLDAIRTCRRTADVKSVMRDLVQLLDQKQVPWTVRVAAALGRGKPGGELADYLGPNVMSALWREDA